MNPQPSEHFLSCPSVLELAEREGDRNWWTVSVKTDEQSESARQAHFGAKRLSEITVLYWVSEQSHHCQTQPGSMKEKKKQLFTCHALWERTYSCSPNSSLMIWSKCELLSKILQLGILRWTVSVRAKRKKKVLQRKQYAAQTVGH